MSTQLSANLDKVRHVTDCPGTMEQEMFFIKKLVSQFFYPLPCATILLTCGIVLLVCTRRQKLGKLCAVLGLLVLVVCSYTTLSSWTLYTLERQYMPLFTPLESSQAAIDDPTAIRWIVVLSHSHRYARRLPATSQLSDRSLARVVEAIRIHRHLPHATLLFSGGMPHYKPSHGAVMASAAQELGVEREDIVIGPRARDTHEEAIRLSHYVGKEPFVLVTSASHMPRSMALFTKLAMQPIPSPGDQGLIAADAPRLRLGHFFPQARQLQYSTRAVHEYLGLLWAKLRGLS